jgi:hypothetical protein
LVRFGISRPLFKWRSNTTAQREPPFAAMLQHGSQGLAMNHAN